MDCGHLIVFLKGVLVLILSSKESDRNLTVHFLANGFDVNYEKVIIQLVVIILWFVCSVVLIAFFPVEWGRTLVYMLAEGFGYDAVRVNQTIELDPIIKQFPYVVSLGLLVVSTIILNYKYVCTETRRFGRDAHAAWSFALRSGRQHAANNKSVMIGLGVVTLIGLSLRLIYLNEPIRGDEAYTFTQYARRPLFLGLTQYYVPNNHFLNTMLMRFSYLVFGNEPWALRIPVLCAGVLLIPATYFVGVRLYSSGVGLVASALVSSCSVLIEFSTNARGYTLLSLLFLCLFGLATYLYHSKNSAAWIAYIALSVAGFFTLPTMVYGYSIVALWLLTILISNRTSIRKGHSFTYLLSSSVVIACITLLVYWPVWVISDAFADALFRHGAMERGKIFSLLPNYVWHVYLHWTRDLPEALIWGTLGLFCLGAVGSRVADRGRVPMALVTAIAIFSLLIVRPVLPFYRVWLFLLPLYFLVVSVGILNLISVVRRKTISAGAGLWLGLAMMIVVSQGSVTLAKDSVRISKATGTFLGGEQAVSYIASRMNQNDVVTTSNYTSANVRYYLDRGRSSAKLTWSVEEMVGSWRVFIIVNTLYDETAPGLVEYSTLRQAGFNEPALFATFPHTKVFMMTKTSS